MLTWRRRQKNMILFGGEIGENIEVWIRDVLVIGEDCCWTEEKLCKVMILSLRGKALSWASQTLSGKIREIRVEELVRLLKKRFGADNLNDLKLSKFLERGIPTSREDFSGMLKDATVIYECNSINLAALSQMIVHRSPIEIKGVLYQSETGASSWEEFIQIAEEISWIAYPDRLLSRVEEENYSKSRIPQGSKRDDRRNNSRGHLEELVRQEVIGKRYCVLHGEGNQTTKNCKRFTEIILAEREKCRKSKF